MGEKCQQMQQHLAFPQGCMHYREVGAAPQRGDTFPCLPRIPNLETLIQSEIVYLDLPLAVEECGRAPASFPPLRAALEGPVRIPLSKITPMTPSQSLSCFSHLCSTRPSLTCLSIFILQENIRGRILFVLLIPESPVPVGVQMHICWVKVSKGKNQMPEQTKPHSCFPVP